MDTVTETKRKELQAFIERVLKPTLAVEAVVGIGGLVSGRINANDPIEAIVFMEPLDYYIVPAEFIWRVTDGTFHSIYDEEAYEEGESVRFRLTRLDWAKWQDPNFYWPEPRRAELCDGWIVYDRMERVTPFLVKRTAYSETLRQSRLDQALTIIDRHLEAGAPKIAWEEEGPAVAHDLLQTAFHYLGEAIFAYNRCWVPWRSQRMQRLLSLGWLPANFEERVLLAANATGLNYEDYQTRADAVREFFYQLLDRLTADGEYSAAPVDQALVRVFDEPGYSWNMDDWNAEKLSRLLEEHES